jgi:hypothetical protein
MKAFLEVLILGGLLCVQASAQVTIDSLNRNGELTWTNSVSNATYRVEWAGSLAGPWQPFSVLTNLDSITASNTSVTVTVPMFYRVVWTDPPVPQPVGDWEFKGYDASGTLVVTGLVSIPTGYLTNAGFWSFDSVPNGTNTWSISPCSAGEAWASLWQFCLSVLLRGPGCGVEGAFFLGGTLLGDQYSGTWYVEGFFANPVGHFVAHRQSKPNQASVRASESRLGPTIPLQRNRR